MFFHVIFKTECLITTWAWKWSDNYAQLFSWEKTKVTLQTFAGFIHFMHWSNVYSTLIWEKTKVTFQTFVGFHHFIHWRDMCGQLFFLEKAKVTFQTSSLLGKSVIVIRLSRLYGQAIIAYLKNLTLYGRSNNRLINGRCKFK